MLDQSVRYFELYIDSFVYDFYVVRCFCKNAERPTLVMCRAFFTAYYKSLRYLTGTDFVSHTWFADR